MIGGTLPGLALAITRAALSGDPATAAAASERLEPIWKLFTEFGGSLRVVAAIAEHLGLVGEQSLPHPIQGLNEEERQAVARALDAVGEIDLR